MNNNQIIKQEKDDSELLAIIEKISNEARHRQIVPFLGAGVSISAGFPTIKLVAEYLAKVDFAIYFGIYEDRFPDLDDGHKAGDTYRQHPSKYLEDFGWPDIGQLNADLWAWLGRINEEIDHQEYQIKIKKFRGEGRRKIWEKECDKKNKHTLYAPLAEDITPFSIETGDNNNYSNNKLFLSFRDHLRAIIQWTLRKELAEREGGTTKAMATEWINWKKHYFNIRDILEEPELLYGDWEILLDRLCEGNFNLADALFTSFGYGLKPTLSHRYLAFIQPKLGIPLILTTNFDSFLEQALDNEGIPPKVFDVHRDAELRWISR